MPKTISFEFSTPTIQFTFAPQVSTLLEQVENTIQIRRLFVRGQRILVAVSGGLDSMVLLWVLRKLVRKHGWRLTVAHLNHQLRGHSSGADQRLVCRTAKELGLPVIVESAKVRAAAKTAGVSLEMAARQLRHEFLARAAEAAQADTIALAHHADDQVELFFLRLLRGSGTEALAGMKWRWPSPANPRLMLVRPLLDQSKSALREFAREQRIRFREDKSNACLEMQRNRLRHELLPLLRKRYQPALTSTALRLMDVIAAEAEVVAQTARDWLRLQGAGGGSSAKSFTDLPVAVQRRCLHLQLLELGITPDYDLIECLRLTTGRRISVGGQTSLRSVHRNPANLFCFRNTAGLVSVEPGAAFNGACSEIDLGLRAGQIAFGGLNLTWKPLKFGRSRPKTTVGEEFFDADLVGSRITLRHWQPGDRFQPIGMRQPVKLQDIFTNQKVARARRHHLVIATTVDGEIFWVEGLRISERFKLTKRTIRRLQWCWQRL